MKRLALFLVLLSVLVPAGLALRAQEAPPMREKLDDMIKTLRATLADAERRSGGKQIRFEQRIYDVRDLTYPIKDYPGGDINLLPSGGFGFGFSEGEEFEPVAFFKGDAIADMVRDNVAPGSWGELRSVDVQYREGGLLIVRHTPGVHARIAKLLDELRERAASQVIMKIRLLRAKDETLRGILGAESAFVMDEGAEARLTGAIRDGGVEVVHDGSITCTNTQRVALSDWVQVTYMQDYDVEIAQGSAIPDPIIQSLKDGYIVDVRPTVAGAGDLVILDVKAQSSRLQRPLTAMELPLGTIETPELEVLKLRTTLALPLGRTVIVGGVLSDGDGGGLLVLVTPVAFRHGGR